VQKNVQTIVITGNYARWVYQFRLGLLKKFKDMGFHVVVAAAPDPFVKKLTRMGIHFEPIQVNFYGNNPFADLWLLWQLTSLYRRYRPDLVIHYTIKPNIFGGIAARWCGVLSYAVVTGLGHVMNKRNRLASWAGLGLYRFTLRLHQKVFVLNRQDRDDLIQMDILTPEKIMLLPGEGVDTHFYAPLSDKKLRTYPSFLFSGRLIADKGIFEFVEAARVIRSRYPEARFRILGMIDPQGIHSIPIATLQEWVREGIVEYLGETLDVRPYLAKADCLVLPSYYREGLSRMLMEAASMETPIITTDQPGCREVVDEGRTGFLCNICDVNDLANKMEQFINLDKVDRLIMGKNARIKMIREFDERLVIKRYLGLLQIRLELQQEAFVY